MNQPRLNHAKHGATAKVPHSNVWQSKWAKWFFIPMGILVPATLISILADYAPLGFIQMPTDGHLPRAINILDIIIYAFWAIVPPSWFFFEYTYHFPADRKRDPLAMDDMKYVQELGAKSWSGLLVLFGLALLLKYNFHVG